MYFLYILRSLKDDKLYIGVSGDVEKRLKQHNNGQSKSTSFRKPFTLIYKESFQSKSDAYEERMVF